MQDPKRVMLALSAGALPLLVIGVLFYGIGAAFPASLPATPAPETASETTFGAAEGRASALRLALLAAGIFLTFATVTTYLFYRAPLAMMTGPDQVLHGVLSTQASVRWGGAYTVLLICAALPALAGFFLDRARLQSARPDHAAPPLFPGAAFGANIRRLAAFFAVIAPASIVPLFEALQKLTGN